MIDLDALRVPAGGPADLPRRDPADRAGAGTDDDVRARCRELVGSLADLQYRLEAEGERAVLLALQGMPSAGKDETIRAALDGLNPMSYRTVHFGPVEGEAAEHDPLWRFHRALPEYGEVGIFNRCWIEAVVSDRVWDRVPQATWRRRYEHLRAFERMLTDEGVELVKCYLHLSRDEQAARLRGRIEDPDRRWELDPHNVDDHERYDDFLTAYDDALSETSIDEAPWYVVPADVPAVRDLAVLEILHARLAAMAPEPPDDVFDDRELEEIRERLGEGPVSDPASALDDE